MTDNPWLSVVMPVHNGAAFLGTTLSSVAAERPQGVEFILFDSSEDDACRAIAAHYADRIDIGYHHTPKIMSWTDKTNAAIEQARAPHVAMLHQDDIWLNGHLSEIRRVLRNHPDAVMQIGPSVLIDRDGRTIGRWTPAMGTGLIDGDEVARRLIVQNVIAIPSPVITRSAWQAVSGLDPNLWYTADWDLYLKLAQRGDIAVRSLATTAFRLHGSSLTMTGRRDIAAFRAQMDDVVARHGHVADGPILTRARASVAVNTALAKASAGNAGAALAAWWAIVKLGPVEAMRYARGARLFERVWPRLRLRLAGAL